MEMATYYITTLGCLKNQADSRSMETSLLRAGLTAAKEPDGADFHFINSCAFIEEAKKETIETVLEAAQIKEKTPGQKLVLVGCFSERYAKSITRELPEVDLSLGTKSFDTAGKIIQKEFFDIIIKKSAEKPRNKRLNYQRKRPGCETSPYAPVKIADGCNRQCAFCAIPLFRGEFRSRPSEAIIKECTELAQNGIREISLVSQNSGDYGGGVGKILDLIEQLQEIDDLKWIRLHYLYPDKRTVQILQGIEKRKIYKVVPYLESPVQHVSPGILRKMRRSGSYEFYVDLFEMARATIPALEIRTTFLLGFPGETMADIDLLIRFLQEVRPEKLALFPFSREEGTIGFSLIGDVSSAETAQRINLVRGEHLILLKEIQIKRVGQIFSCMLDESGKESIRGHRAQDAPEVDPSVTIEGLSEGNAGDILDVKITGFYEYDMSAIPVIQQQI